MSVVGSLTWNNCIFSRLDKLDSIYDLDKCKRDSGLCRIIRVYRHFLWLSGCTWPPNLFRQSHLIRILSENINLFVRAVETWRKASLLQLFFHVSRQVQIHLIFPHNVHILCLLYWNVALAVNKLLSFTQKGKTVGHFGYISYAVSTTRSAFDWFLLRVALHKTRRPVCFIWLVDK